MLTWVLEKPKNVLPVMGGTAWLKVLEVASAQKIPGKDFKAVRCIIQ